MSIARTSSLHWWTTMSWESVVSLCISPSPSLVTRLQACRSFILSSPLRQMFGMLEIWSSLCVVQSSAICPRISMMLLIWIFQAHYPSILLCMCVIRSELMSLMGQLAVDSHVEQKIVEVHDQFFACIALEDSLFSLQFPTIYSTISNPNSTPQLVYSHFFLIHEIDWRESGTRPPLGAVQFDRQSRLYPCHSSFSKWCCRSRCWKACESNQKGNCM